MRDLMALFGGGRGAPTFTDLLRPDGPISQDLQNLFPGISQSEMLALVVGKFVTMAERASEAEDHFLEMSERAADAEANFHEKTRSERRRIQQDASARTKAAVAAKNVQLRAIGERARALEADLLAQRLSHLAEAGELKRTVARLQAESGGSAFNQESKSPQSAPPTPTARPESEAVEDEVNYWRETAEHQAEVIRQLRLSLTHAVANRGPAADGTVVDSHVEERTLADIGDWAADNADRVIVLKRARNAAKKAVYEDAGLVYRALDMLATTYRNVKLNLVDRMAFKRAAEELGLEIGGTGTDHGMPDYYFSWKERRVFLDQHIGRGNSRDPRYCFRCYFTWDAEEAKVIVGMLPAHLPTGNT